MQIHNHAFSPQPSNLPPAAASVERAQRRIGPVDMEVTTRGDAVRDILHAVRQRQPRVFAFCNMHTFNVAYRSTEVAAALGMATVYNDGVGIDIASRILYGTPFPENLNGTDLTPALLTAFDRPVAVYVLGGLPGVAAQAGAALAAQFSNVRIVGTHDGYFSAADNNQIADAIRQAHTELVLVGMGNPRQELWAADMCPRAGAVMLCIGAYIDFAAGRISRAPAWVRRWRCEWVYRLALEPARMWRRYIGGASPFLWAVLGEKFARSRA